MNKEIKKYIDSLNNEQLIEILNTSEDIDEYLNKNYIGTKPIKRNDEVEHYIKTKIT